MDRDSHRMLKGGTFRWEFLFETETERKFLGMPEEEGQLGTFSDSLS